MALWQRFWLLLSGIWALVCLLNAFSIVAFSEGEAQKAWQPLLLSVAVPALGYALAWGYLRLRRR
jgi:hypothetical protein